MGMERFTVVQSCTKPRQATPSVRLAGFTRGNTQLTRRGEMCHWLNPFSGVVFAGLTPTGLCYGANQVDDVFYDLSSRLDDSLGMMTWEIYVLWLLSCSGFEKVIFLYLRLQLSIRCILNINTGICIHWKRQAVISSEQSGIHKSAGFTEAGFTRFE